MTVNVRLNCGAASVDITPALGTHVTGGVAQHRPAQAVLDPLFVKVVWFTRGDNSQYTAMVVERTVAAMAQARAALRPVRTAFGRTIEGRLAFNRRVVLRDGTVMMPPRGWLSSACAREALHLEGPIDPELALLLARDDADQMVTALAHYTCHPVNVFPQPMLSADWPGAWAHYLRSDLGAACLPVVLNGCCGDVNPWDPWDPHYTSDHDRMGRLLAESSRRVTSDLEWRDDADLSWRLERLELPIRAVDAQPLAEAERYLSEHPRLTWQDGDCTGSPDWNWINAAMRVGVDRMRRQRPTLSYELQLLHIGEVALLGLPGEPFAEAALRLKAASPFKLTFTVHCTSHYVGYLPTQRAFAHGGHEVNLSSWSKLVPEALETVIKGATKLLRSSR